MSCWTGPEYADYWALKWADLLRVDRQALGHKRAYALLPLDPRQPGRRTSRSTSSPARSSRRRGRWTRSAPASFYKVVTKPGEAASTLSQVFLGVRIACAECHHHPFDRWSQADYYGMPAFFAPVGVQADAARRSALPRRATPTAKHPRTGETVSPTRWATPMPDEPPAGDRAPALADWMTAPDNPCFARNLANRLWAHFLGRGLVEPVDDVRATNPPTQPRTARRPGEAPRRQQVRPEGS